MAEHANKSAAAEIDGSKLLAWITSARLGPRGNWKGSTHSFILHWVDTVRRHESLDGKNHVFSDVMKMTMLQNWQDQTVYSLGAAYQQNSNKPVDQKYRPGNAWNSRQ